MHNELTDLELDRLIRGALTARICPRTPSERLRQRLLTIARERQMLLPRSWHSRFYLDARSSSYAGSVPGHRPGFAVVGSIMFCLAGSLAR